MYVHNAHNAHETLERRRILKSFRMAGATTPEHACTIPRLGLKDSPFLRRFKRQQIIREVKSGEFYLDEDALREQRATMLRWLAVPLALILMLMIYALVSVKH